MCNPRAPVSRPDYYGNPAGDTSDIDVVRSIYDAFAARDLDGALAHLAPDCELHLRGTQQRIGRTEPYKGHDGMREYLADVERTWEDLVLHATDYRAIPGAVVVMGHVEGRYAGRADQADGDLDLEAQGRQGDRGQGRGCRPRALTPHGV